MCVLKNSNVLSFVIYLIISLTTSLVMKTSISNFLVFLMLCVILNIIITYVFRYSGHHRILFMDDTTVNVTYIYRNASQQVSNEVNFLTLMTSFSNKIERHHIETNTIINWSSLGENVSCLNWYVNSTILNRISERHGWRNVLAAYTSHQLPIAKYLYIEAPKMINSSYYGFANSDILFNSRLIESLRAIHEFHQQYHPGQGFLMVGRRTNIESNLIKQESLNYSNIDYYESKGTLFRTDAIDYFVTSAHGFPWDTSLEVVIGRSGWDNYVVSLAYDNKIPSYDVTETVPAIHQSYSGKGNRGSDNIDAQMNFPILKMQRRDMIKHILAVGHTISTNYFTKRSLNDIVIMKRPKRIGRRRPLRRSRKRPGNQNNAASG